jgi:hypothetical protein
VGCEVLPDARAMVNNTIRFVRDQNATDIFSMLFVPFDDLREFVERHVRSLITAVAFCSVLPNAGAAELYDANGRSVVVQVQFLSGIQYATGINYGFGAVDTPGETERATLSLGLKPKFDLN